MMWLGTWISNLSVRLQFTINMVESKHAHYRGHPRRAVSGVESESSARKAFCEGIGSSKRGIRAPATQVEKGEACNPSAYTIEEAKGA